VRVPADRISNSFRPGEIVDDAQIEELRRWQLLDFVAEPDDDYISDSLIVTVCGCGRSGTTLTRVMLDSHPALFAGPGIAPVPAQAHRPGRPRLQVRHRPR
jgi:hypothetical protein